MSKECWIECYEAAIADIADELDISMAKAQNILDNRIKMYPGYLDGPLDAYLTGRIDNE